jgi:hypothetical protein
VGETEGEEELSNFFGDVCFGACVSNTARRPLQTAFKKEDVSSMLSEATLAGKYKPGKSITCNKSINPFLERNSWFDNDLERCGWGVVNSSMFVSDGRKTEFANVVRILLKII